MAKKGGAPENLKPVRTKEEAKKRGANGGKKSGEARRRKRDAQQAAQLILGLPCSDKFSGILEQLGIAETDQTNIVALFARMYTVAMSGDSSAARFIIEMSGTTPRQKLERERFRAEQKAEEGSNNAVDDWVAAAIEADKNDKPDGEET